MPNKIIVEDIIDEMINNIDYIKLNTYIELEKDDQVFFYILGNFYQVLKTKKTITTD